MVAFRRSVLSNARGRTKAGTLHSYALTPRTSYPNGSSDYKILNWWEGWNCFRVAERRIVQSLSIYISRLVLYAQGSKANAPWNGLVHLEEHSPAWRGGGASFCWLINKVVWKTFGCSLKFWGWTGWATEGRGTVDAPFRWLPRAKHPPTDTHTPTHPRANLSTYAQTLKNELRVCPFMVPH